MYVMSVTQALLGACHGELPLQEIRDQDGGFTDRPAPRAIAMKGAQAVLAHEARDAMLAAGLSGLTQVQEDARRAVDPLTRDERRPDQTQQPGILLGTIREWLLSHS